MNFKKVLISELKPAAYNPRKNLSEKDPEYQRIRKSIETFGYVDPVIVNADHTVIGGHQRLKVLKDLGHAQIDVVLLDIPKTQEKALNIALNKITGEWDFQQLSIVLSELKEEDFDIEITGFSDKELKEIDEELFGKQVQQLDTEPQISRAEELRKEWGTELGQMWQCGDHRVLCGDCTDPAVVARVGGGEAGIMVTDPPYGVEYDPEWRLRSGLNKEHQTRAEGIVYNDNRSDWQAAWDLFQGAVAYVWHAGVGSPTVAHSLIESGFELRALICWVKPSLVISRGHYHHQHEPCWYAVRKGKTADWVGDRKQSTVFDIPNMHRTQGCVDDGKTCHSTQKPMGCMSRPIQNHGFDTVYDPFLGSGTTLIACENLGRKCRGCEIDPGYVAVILQRYKDTFPGKEMRLIADNSGA